MANYTSGEQFINKLYNNLINSEEVKRSIRRSDSKISNREDMLKAYFDRLEKSHAITSGRKLELLKHFYYEKYLIKELPEDYIELQKKIAKERGYGDIDVTEEMKEKMLEEVRKEQKASLDSWISYLTDSNAMYPTWFKYYAFQGMIKLGKFDKEKGEFTKRTNSTVTPFIECNPEILGQMYNILQKTINKEELTEKEEEALSNGESFKKLYKYFYVGNYKEQENLKETKGIWIKYDQGYNYRPLWKSLQGKNTGWCTAGEENCKSQIENGDFYVYYTYDKEGKPTNPRIAIRMNGKDSIGEIRGIGDSQNLEPEMLPILNEKLNEFPDKDKYLKKEHDMKILTEIDNKLQKGEELTKEELMFLYEIDGEIEGFGWKKDPRIDEIKEKRDNKKDLSKCFEYNEDEIAVGFDEVNLKTKIIFDNHKIISDFDIINKIKKLVEINKKTDRKEEPTKEELKFLYEIDSKLKSSEWPEKAERIEKETKKKRKIKKDFAIIFNVKEEEVGTKPSDLKSGIIKVYIGAKLSVNFGNVNKLQNLIYIKKADFKLLTCATYLKKLQEIIGDSYFSSLTSSEGLENLQYIGGSAYFNLLTSSDGLGNLQYIGGGANFSSLISAKGLENLKSIGRTVGFNSLNSLDGLNSNLVINGDAYFSDEITIDDIINSGITINGNIYIDNELVDKNEIKLKAL